MRFRRPVIMCDAEDYECGAWDVDHYEETVDTFDGIKITDTHRALGWVSTADADFCPEHASEAKQ